MKKNYRSIVSRRWKEIKEGSAKLSACSDWATQMKNEAEKPTKFGDDPSVSSTEQHQKTVAERSAVKKKYRDNPKKCQSPQNLLIQTWMTQVPRINKNL